MLDLLTLVKVWSEWELGSGNIEFPCFAPGGNWIGMTSWRTMDIRNYNLNEPHESESITLHGTG